MPKPPRSGRSQTETPRGAQAALAARLVAWAAEDAAGLDRDTLRAREDDVTKNLPRLDPDDVATLRAVAASSNFLMREAAAVFMARHARRAYLPIAAALAVDRYGQVWRPARQALDALRAKQPPWTEAQEDEIVGDERGATGLLFTMVRRANGKLRVTVDDVRRQGRGAAFTWRPDASFGKFDFTPEQLDALRAGDPSLAPKLAEIGTAVLGRLTRE